jgi:hypothetical protein
MQAGRRQQKREPLRIGAVEKKLSIDGADVRSGDQPVHDAIFEAL